MPEPSFQTFVQQPKNMFFDPGKANRDNPIGLAVQGTLPVIKCNVFVSMSERQQIDKQVVKLGRAINEKIGRRNLSA